MDDSLYREEILDHYKRPRNWGPMDAPDLEFEDVALKAVDGVPVGGWWVPAADGPP